MTRYATEEKEERFRRLAERRTDAALERIRILGNLSNRRLYAYTNDQVQKILDALKEASQGLEARFRGGMRKKFRL